MQEGADRYGRGEEPAEDGAADAAGGADGKYGIAHECSMSFVDGARSMMPASRERAKPRLTFQSHY